MRNIITLVALLLITSLSANAAYIQSPEPTIKGGTGSSSQSASKAVTTDVSGHIVSSSSTTDTEIGYVHGVTSAIQTQLGNMMLSSAFTDAAVTSKLITGFSSGSGTVAATDTILQAFNKLDGNVGLKLATASFTDAAVTGKLLTGFSASAGAVAATDSILAAFNKVVGNIANKLDTSAFTDAAVTGKVLTGYTSGAGTVAATDSILQAIQKLNGNIAALPGANVTVVDGGNTAYSILAANQHIRASTTLTADRAYTLPACTAGNIGEKHEIKNLPAQTHNITLTAAGSDNIDGSATITLYPGDSVPVVCAAFAAAGTWDIE